MPSLHSVALFLGALLPAVLAAPTTPQAKREVIEGKYIVTLKSSASTESHLSWVNEVHSRSLTKRDTVGVEQTFNISTWHAYSGEFDDATLEEIKNNPDVAYVEEDQVMYLYDAEPLVSRAIVSQTGSTWGLGTISSRTRPSTTYRYDDTAGVGSFAYVVDSGILIGHNQFGGRATNGYNYFSSANVDSVGHGTHVAGTIAGTTYGVAKRASIISVKVFEGTQSTTTAILAGFNWAVNDIVSKNRQTRSVINMSLGGPSQQAWFDAVRAAYNQGVLSVVAAGNGNSAGVPQPVANYSPANVPEAITVAAVDSAWATASFTNYGPLVDVFAPGVSILSSWIGSNTATNSISGTSMACPHVAGLALYLQVLENINTPAAVSSRIVALSTTGGVTGSLNGSPNRIVYNGNA